MKAECMLLTVSRFNIISDLQMMKFSFINLPGSIALAALLLDQRSKHSSPNLENGQT